MHINKKQKIKQPSWCFSLKMSFPGGSSFILSSINNDDNTTLVQAHAFSLHILNCLSCSQTTAQDLDLCIDTDLFSSQPLQEVTDLPPTLTCANGTAFWLLLSLERSFEGPSALEFIPHFAQKQPPIIFDLLSKL